MAFIEWEILKENKKVLKIEERVHTHGLLDDVIRFVVTVVKCVVVVVRIVSTEFIELKTPV